MRLLAHRSGSSSSGSGWFAASSISLLYCWRSASSTCTVGGARATPATNSCIPHVSSWSGRTRSLVTYQSWVPNKLSSQPQEWLFKVVVGFCGNVVVLEILLAVESNRLRLDFAFLHIDFVACKDDGNVFADTDEIACKARQRPPRVRGRGFTYDASWGRSCR